MTWLRGRTPQSRAARNLTRWAVRTSLITSTVVWVWGCGDDEDDDPVVSACQEVCEAQPDTCGIPPLNPPDCEAACRFGAAIQPDCADEYAAMISCARERPLLSCQDDSITVSLGAQECLGPLGTYITCAAVNVLPVCVDLPLLRSGCNDPALPRATACVGAVQGCELQAGAVVNEGEVGIFCCP